jgi:hypothetical protein
MILFRPTKKLKNIGMGVLLLSFCLMCQFMVLMVAYILTNATSH